MKSYASARSRATNLIPGLHLLIALLGLGALVSLSGCARKPQPNVLLVTFDTTRWDRMSYAGGPKGITPMLDAMAARGTWFATAMSAQPLTLPSHTSIMTGLYPTHHGTRNNGTFIVNQDNVTLAERLAAEGYQTHAIVSSFVLDSQFGLDQGFEEYDDDLSDGPKKKMFMFKEVTAAQTTVRAVRWLEQERDPDRPFFLWIHYFDPHANYEPPPDVAALFPDDPYEGEIHFADRELGRVLKSLDESAQLDDTLFVFTADHGDSLGEHGERTHGLFIYESTTHVPLIFSGPGVPSGKSVSEVVRSVDITPTVLGLVGAKAPKGLDGRTLVPLWKGKKDEPRVAYIETLNPRMSFGWSELRALRDQDYRVIEAPKREAYALREDPNEHTNLLARKDPEPAVRQRLRELREIVENDPWVNGEQVEGELDPASKEKLEALGYLWGGQSDVNDDKPRPDPKDRLLYWEEFQRAQQLIRNNQLEEARVAMTTLVETDSENVVARSSLANVLQKMGQREQALEMYKKIIELDPRREKAYLSAARILSSRSEFDEAVALLQSVIKMRPRSPDAHSILGETYTSQGATKKAEEAFLDSLDVDPAYAPAATGLSNLLNREGRVKEALEVLSAAYERNKDSPSITYNLAVVSERLGDLDRAIELYKNAIRLNPDDSLSWNNLGSLLNRVGQKEKALQLIERAVDLGDGNAEAAFNLGILYAEQDRTEDALHAFETALEANPTFVQAASARAQLFETTKRSTEARRAWTSLAEFQPTAYLQLARFELGRGRRSAARAALAQAREKLGASYQQRLERFPKLAAMGK